MLIEILLLGKDLFLKNFPKFYEQLILRGLHIRKLFQRISRVAGENNRSVDNEYNISNEPVAG